MVKIGEKNENFEKSLELEVGRLEKYKDQSDYLSYLRHSYVHQGLYAQMIDRYLQYFSLDNFLFIHFENELLQERELTIKRILEFLEIDSSVLLRTDIRSNPSSKEKSKSLKQENLDELLSKVSQKVLLLKIFLIIRVIQYG